MKILTLTNLYPPFYVGGYELRCAAIVEALRARGHSVQVLTSNHGVTASEPAQEEGVERSLRVHGFFGHPWLDIMRLADLERHNNRTLRAAVQRFNPDIIHIWNMGGISKSLCHTVQTFGVPVVYDVSDHWIARSLKADVWLDWWNRPSTSLKQKALRHGWTLTGQRNRFNFEAPTDPPQFIRFDHIYFCSAALRELTVSAGYPVCHGEVIHCPVDIERFTGTVHTHDGMKRLLYVGRLAEDKGVMTALKAMQAVKSKFAGELHVYGRGDAAYTHSLHSYVATHQLPVHFHEASADQMPDVYRAHDALLFTSEWEEPFALTPLEAMACGLPVIGTTTGGSKELFRCGSNALTYTAGNHHELAARIVQLDNSRALRNCLAVTGQREVRTRLHQDLIVSQIEDYLCRCLQEKQTRRPNPALYLKQAA